jgi:hypothetical protein
MSCVIVINDATHVNVAFTCVNRAFTVVKRPFTLMKKALRKRAASGASHDV